MAMAIVWTGMVVLAVLCGIGTGNQAEVAVAAVEGAESAITLCLSIGGMMCLWTGVMEVMRRAGLADKLSGLLRPVLVRLFPEVKNDRETLNSISANVSANLLGLGSAVTPLGLEAARGLSRHSRGGVATDALCMLVVCNTASIQLIPTTVATLRTAAGSETPFDILPAVWLASTISVVVGITACCIFRRIWGRCV